MGISSTGNADEEPGDAELWAQREAGTLASGLGMGGQCGPRIGVGEGAHNEGEQGPSSVMRKCTLPERA